jgi:hypothetical protein
MKTPEGNSHEAKISKLYQTLKVETPPSWLDEKIQQEAKTAIELTAQRKQTESVDKPVLAEKPKRVWMAWQWPASLAASVCFLCLLWWQLAPALLPVAKDVSELSYPVATQQVDPVIAGQTEAQFPQLQDSAARDKKQEALVRSRQQNEPTQELTQMAGHKAMQSAPQSRLLNTETTEHHSPAMAETRLTERNNSLDVEYAEEADQERHELSRVDALSMLTDRIAKQTGANAVTDLIDLIRQNLTEQQLAKAEQDDKRMATLDKKRLKLQAQLFSHLLQELEQNPKFEVSPEILNLLNDEQRRVWQTTLKEQ